MEDFVYERELWALRASVAAECGEELGELARSLGRVVQRNYFGEGCTEGLAVFDAMAIFVDSEVEAMELLAENARTLAHSAESAIRALERSDQVGADVIG